MGEHTGWRSRGYLPHFDSAETIQTITFRLADSLPKSVCDELARLSDVEKRRSRLDAVLDHGRGSCALRAAPAAVIVQDALGFFDGERYKLLAWVVMPNHGHVMIEQTEGYRKIPSRPVLRLARKTGPIRPRDPGYRRPSGESGRDARGPSGRRLHVEITNMEFPRYTRRPDRSE